MVLGRLFVWAAAIAGGLLVLAIGFLIGEQVNKPPRSAESEQASASTGDIASPEFVSRVSTGDLGDTYHPTEALVTKLQPVASYDRATTFTGELVSQHRSSLAFEVNGLVSEVVVDRGYSVKRNDLIAKIDPADLNLRRKQAQAERARAAAVLAEMKAGPRETTLQAAKAEVEAIKAELINLSKQLTRQRQLAKDGVIAESELDAIQSATTAAEKRQQAAQRRLDELESGTRKEQIDAQEAVLAAVQSQLELLDLQLEKTQLLAPFDGVILDTFVDQGAVVAAGQQVAQLVDDQHLEAHIGVPPEIAAEITATSKRNKDVTYALQISGRVFHCAFDRVLPVVDPVTQTALVVFQVDTNMVPSPTETAQANAEHRPAVDHDSAPALYSGASVQLRWHQRVETEGYWVPNQALSQARRGLWSLYEFKVDPDSGSAEQDIPNNDSTNSPVMGRVTKIQVEVLYAQRNRSFVRGTLNDQPWIVVKGAHRLLDRQRVQVKQAAGTNLNGDQTVESDLPSNKE